MFKTQIGMAAHVFHVTQSMEDDYFMNADGELLIVPQTRRTRHRDRVRPHRFAALRDRGDPARN